MVERETIVLSDVERRVLRALSAEPRDPREAIPALDEGGHDVCERLVRAGLLAWDSPLVYPEVTAAGREVLGVGEWEDIVLYRCPKCGEVETEEGIDECPYCNCTYEEGLRAGKADAAPTLMVRLAGRVRPDTGDEQ